MLFSWQPFDFGVRHAQVRSAQLGYEYARHAVDLTKLDVESTAAGAFLDLAAARQTVRAQRANVQRMEAFSRSIHVLVDNTLRPGADASQADAQLALARTQLIQAQTQEKVRLEALANLLQMPSEQITIDDAAVLGDAPAEPGSGEQLASHPAIEQQIAITDQARNNSIC